MRRLAIGALFAALAVTACGSDDPAADEERVCTAVQTIVDELGADRPQSALATLPELELAVNATENETLATAGQEFFDDLFTDIDYTQLTVEQTASLGDQYQQQMAISLARIVDECSSVGSSIEGL